MNQPIPPSTTWRKSSHSESLAQECIEVAQVGRVVAVRDSKNPGGPVLTFTASAWHSFLTEIRTTAGT